MRKDFLKIGVGYRVLGGIKFYERAEVKDAVAYLRIVNQKFDDLALERVWEQLKEEIGEATLKQIYEFGKKQKLCLEDSIIKLLELNKFKPKIKKIIEMLMKMISKWRIESKKIKHHDLLKLILDSQDIQPH